MNLLERPINLSIVCTSEGERPHYSLAPISFKKTNLKPHDYQLIIEPNHIKQELFGIGTSFTESSAFVLSHLSNEMRLEVMNALFSKNGANFSLCRVPIGSCDFSVEGCYSHADEPSDTSLGSFSLIHDIDGFSSSDYEGVLCDSYDIIPMLKEAFTLKGDSCEDLRLIASAWTAPPWMKDINDWYISPKKENGYQGTGGELLEEYFPHYSEYLCKFITEYKALGIDIWGLTIVNEPLGNNGQWESMHFSAFSQSQLIANFLGPTLLRYDLSDIKLLTFDHNRDELLDWVEVVYNDTAAERYVSGAAIHWYESSVNVSEKILEKVHRKFPEKIIIHTEGCIDDLGNDAPEGILDPVGYKEKDWFQNDFFWWNKLASDWAYSATWEHVDVDEHPMYAPVHRYAKNIILSLNHWVSGWVDWNCVLDERGGPNHVGNYCGAPIMINYRTNDIYYTPVFYILAQFSKSIRPGDVVVSSTLRNNTKTVPQLYCCVTKNSKKNLLVHVFNESVNEKSLEIVLGEWRSTYVSPANSLSSLEIHLNQH